MTTRRSFLTGATALAAHSTRPAKLWSQSNAANTLILSVDPSIDFRGKRETRGNKIDWFANCRTATRAHREWCYTGMAKQFPTYTEDIWGITSSSSPKGYKAWRGPPIHSKPDGTIVPCAAGGSLMLTPDTCISALHAMKEEYGDKIWGKYGLADSFNPQTGWVSTDTLGLDVGMTLLATENLRTGNLWKWFMANPEPQKAMHLAGIEKI